ncbi:hypothetical protein ZWY2020_039711 [Hordeum vulgare]|nr:hypothetical protein ZWY2020_039711 [Hordeum vulgare]
MINLNELPPDLSVLPNDDIEFVQPGVLTQSNPEHCLMDDVDVNMQSESLTIEDTNTTVAEPTKTELRAGAVGGDQNVVEEDETFSQPMEPFVGMRFGSQEGVKDHYNDYALRTGFSIKMNTSRRSAKTNILEKQQFACKKFRKPKEDDVGVELPPVLDPIRDNKPLCEKDEMEEVPIFHGEESEQKKKKKKKKRKRERIKQTECTAKMVVKLKDGWWEVTHFIRDHSHPLVPKPSLSKYLRSHKGIPSEEKRFLEILHNCNLTLGVFSFNSRGVN